MDVIRSRILPVLVIAVAIVAAFALADSGGASETMRGGAAAAGPPTADLWVDANGGSCARAGTAATYRDGAACGSIDAAWDACRPGDRIAVKAGTYAAQTITGDQKAPGCTVRGEPGTVLADLVTAGSFFTLSNVTVDVGGEKHAGWKATSSDVTLRDVRLHGPFVRVDIYRVRNVRWLGGELGVAGQTGGQRVCGQDALPVQIGEASGVTFEGIRFHPQDADHTPSPCSSNGFHLEMIRLDGGTSAFTIRNSTFDSGDHSGTASVFITVPSPGSSEAPRDLTFENNFFGTNESVGAFDVHSNVTRCVDFTFAYNTFLKSPGLFQCTEAVNVHWIGNLGANGPSSPCFGTSINNVWQDPRRDSCGSDRWVTGARGQVDRLGLGGPDGFRVQARSPAINAGEPSGYCTAALRSRDHDGQGRPHGRRCDAGADEHDLRGPGPVAATLDGARWNPATAGRVLIVELRVDEPVSAELKLGRGAKTIATRTYRRLPKGARRLTIAVPPGVARGRARFRVTVEDAARDVKVVQRAVVIPD